MNGNPLVQLNLADICNRPFTNIDPAALCNAPLFKNQLRLLSFRNNAEKVDEKNDKHVSTGELFNIYVMLFLYQY